MWPFYHEVCYLEATLYLKTIYIIASSYAIISTYQWCKLYSLVLGTVPYTREDSYSLH